MTSLLICPRCERELEGHDDKACQRRMSRRYFFGLGAGALAAAVVVPQVIQAGQKVTVDFAGIPEPGYVCYEVQGVIENKVWRVERVVRFLPVPQPQHGPDSTWVHQWTTPTKNP